MLAAGLSAYGASKAALEASCVTWAKDLDGTGVTVNVLVPGGPTDTPGFFPPGMPRPPVLLDPQIMAVPIVWLPVRRRYREPFYCARLGHQAAALASRCAGACACRLA